MHLFKNFVKFKKNVALLNNDQKITYGDLLKSNTNFKKKIKKKSSFFIILDNSIYCIHKYINIISNKHLAILADDKTNLKDIDKLIYTYKPNYIISNKIWLSKTNIKNLKLIEDDENYVFISTNFKFSKIHKNLSLLLPTSGSMASLKYAKLTDQNLKFNSDKIKDYLNINTKDRSITSMQPSYSFMLSIIHSHIDNGASLYVTKESLLQKKFWEELKIKRITSFSGVPFMFELLLKLGLEKIKTNSIRVLTQAGGNLDKNIKLKIISFCKRNKLKFITMYGQTEASPRISYLDWKKALSKNGSIGKNISDTKMWLVDTNYKKINSPYIEGEIIFKGKNVFGGYAYGYKDLNKIDKSNLLKTGDLAYFDKEGFYFITGRKSKFAKVYGVRINLEELEQNLKIRKFESACLNYKNHIIIFVKKDENKKKLLDLCSKITGQNISIFKIKKIESFPRTSSGKISYQNLKEHIND